MNNEERKQLATFQFKIPRPLWKKFKLKAYGDDKTCTETLIELVQSHVRRPTTRKKTY